LSRFVDYDINPAAPRQKRQRAEFCADRGVDGKFMSAFIRAVNPPAEDGRCGFSLAVAKQPLHVTNGNGNSARLAAVSR
jgi:hypothetical protein